MCGAILLGLLAGAIARAVVPNDAFSSMRGPASWLVSIGLGLVGALVGYWIFAVGLGWGDGAVFDLGGLLGAIIGSVIVVVLASFVLKRVR